MTPPDPGPEPDQPEPAKPAGLPDADEGVASADPQPVPADLSQEQQARVNEAAVSIAEIQAQRARDDRELRKGIADKVFKAVLIQVAIADAVFIFYAHKQGWDFEGHIMDFWLGAAVVQVIAMALVIVRSVFPGDSGN